MWCPRCNRTWADDARFCPQDGSRLSATANVEALSALPSVQSGVLLGARYQVRGFIGKGAMARVYLAQDLDSNEPVAVKVLDVVAHKDREARERFLREATAVAGVDHPNIVKVFDTGERGDGAPYLVMEYLFGESLGAYLRREGKMHPTLAVSLLGKCASALSAAHAVGVIHRDVKPDNLFLIGEPGEPYDIRLLDFGFARLRKSTMTAAGMAVGTAEYMPPEQGLSDPVDARSDVYGLGAVFYRALTGELPFRANDEAELLARTVLHHPTPPRELNPEIPEDLAAIITTALRKRPYNRYPSMDRMLTDLEIFRARRGTPMFAHKPIAPPDTYEPQGPIAAMIFPHFQKLLDLKAEARKKAQGPA
ncbi:MAG: serine/threonine-protein kinase [Polyangiaceae bacterium]